MKLCRIVNLTNMDVCIEDLDIHLGGRASSRLVSLDAALASNDVRVYVDWVKIVPEIPIREVQMPVWPFIGQEKPEPLKPEPVPAPAPQAQAPSTADVASLLIQIRDLLASGAAARPPVQLSRAIERAGGTEYIPSVIVPSVEASISPHEEVVDSADIDEGLAALRKLRHKS